MLQKITIKTIAIGIAINISIAATGQTEQMKNARSITPSIPTSPQAEAFRRYGEYSINYQTGTPDISIPLYEINHRGYKLPLALKYYPQPLKPGYNYDVFGRGWGLSVNSCISRSIECSPDEWDDFKIKISGNTDYVRLYPDISSTLMYYNYVPDKFHAVLPNGIEFDFTIEKINNQLKYMVFGSHPVIVSCSKYDKSNIQQFTVTDEDGVIYTFEEGDTPFWGDTNLLLMRSYVSWQLVSIKLPNSPDLITFNYNDSITPLYNNQIKDKMVKILHSMENVQDGSHIFPKEKAQYYLTDTYQPYNYKMKLLTSISYSEGSIFFDYQKPNNSTRNYVKKITINDAASIEVDLAMTEIVIHPVVATLNDTVAKLDSISIKSSLSSDKPMVYKCKYTGTSGGTGVDHWGFFNNMGGDGRVANFNLFVGFNVTSPDFDINGITPVKKLPQDSCPYYKIKLALDNQNYDNRWPSPPDYHGVLSRLTYPTGGYTDFEFENHCFLTSTDGDGNYIHDPYKKRVTLGGGFRIKKITNYSSDGKVAEVKNFRYGKTYAEAKADNINFRDYASTIPNIHTGVGEAVVDPNISTYMSYSIAFLNQGPDIVRNMVLGLNAYKQNISFSNPFQAGNNSAYQIINGNHGVYWALECNFSSTNFRNLLNGRPPVIYPEVTVYYGDIGEGDSFTPEKTTGKTVYKYDIKDVFNTDTTFFESTKYYGNTLTYDPKSYRYNILKEKIDYRFDGTKYIPVNSEKNNWSYYEKYVTQSQYTNPYPLSYCPYNAMFSDFFTTKTIKCGVALLDSRTITSYSSFSDKDSITLTESYTYNRTNIPYYTNNQLTSKSVINSNAKRVEENYFYPEGSTPEVIKKMVDKNMLSPIIRQEKKSEKLISGYKIDYKEFNPENTSVIVPEKLYQLEDTSYVLSTQILSYTKHGNPQEVVTRDNIHTVYLWSYNYNYLIAEIKNATLSQVSSVVQSEFGIGIDSLAKITPDVTKLKNLRKNANLSNTLITTYTYGPWSKVTSITDPSNKTIYYSYDGFGRLKESYYYENDDASKKRTIETYNYHYKN